MIEKRVIAFDIGDKRIGVAISDPFNEYAMPGETYFRVGKFRDDVENIAKIAVEKGAGTIVCGMPVNFDGSESIQTEKTRKFIEALKLKTNLPVVLEDERFTTMQARDTQIAGGIKCGNRKKTIDSIAASFILDGYLERTKKHKAIEKNIKEIYKEIRTMRENEIETEEEDNVIELIDDDGNTIKLYHVGTIEYKGGTYCFFQKSEPETEEEEDEVVIYELKGEENDQQLYPLEDDQLMDEVFAEFCREYEEYENSDEAMKLDGAED